MFRSSRRDFLKNSALLGVGTAFGALGCAAGLRTVEVATQDDRLTVDTADYEELAAVGGAIQLVSRFGDPLILVRTGENTFHALSSICTHLGCQVRKTRFGFRCPCHGSAFDLRGRVEHGPANEPLPSYPVALSGTMATIDLR